MIEIRTFEETDWPALWRVLEPVFRAGDTYSFAMDISEAEARRVWIDNPVSTFVAESDGGQIAGTYYIKPNQPGRGAHVCNCGYVVAAHARGQGMASALCEHSLQVALAQGFRAMQYNLVAATNEVAVRVWQKYGFKIVGTLPGAFNHPQKGYVDAHVMYKVLTG